MMRTSLMLLHKLKLLLMLTRPDNVRLWTPCLLLNMMIIMMWPHWWFKIELTWTDRDHQEPRAMSLSSMNFSIRHIHPYWILNLEESHFELRLERSWTYTLLDQFGITLKSTKSNHFLLIMIHYQFGHSFLFTQELWSMDLLSHWLKSVSCTKPQLVEELRRHRSDLSKEPQDTWAERVFLWTLAFGIYA